jgi:hypothetical protein
MSYASIDGVIQAWAKEHRLAIRTEYKDSEVHSVDFVGADGHRYQLWIDTPDERGLVGIHAWDFSKRRLNYIFPSAELAAALEQIHALVLQWCDSGRSN